ncbi:hypothetical protein J4Q44_G00128940 [Coregonus suidteri]|uniref:Uncharacterized protein n=1 Tax=Coregonus suidteri TaxID=861788 RepID=A0AAN8QVJ7_9TELE
MENKECKRSEVSGNDLTLIDLDDPINGADVMKEVRSHKDHREAERLTKLDEAVLETDTPTQSQESQEVEGEIEMDEAVAIHLSRRRVEGESEMDEAVAIPSQSQEAAVVTFTTVTHNDATSQTSLTLSRGKRSYPDLHTFVQDMKDDHWNLLSENMRVGMSRHEFSAKCIDIVAWVMESTSTVVFSRP